MIVSYPLLFFFSSRRRHTRLTCDWSSDVCSSDLRRQALSQGERAADKLLPLCSPQTLGLLASFQKRVVAELVTRALRAAEIGRASCRERVESREEGADKE